MVVGESVDVGPLYYIARGTRTRPLIRESSRVPHMKTNDVLSRVLNFVVAKPGWIYDRAELP